MKSTAVPHIPVLLNQVIKFLVTGINGTICDCTVGDGGHSSAILEATSPLGKLIGIDRDGEGIERVKKRLRGFGDRVTLRKGDFAQIEAILSQLGSPRVSGFLFDLGISSSQIEDAERGFSYMRDGPLDMRMDRSDGRSAQELVNQLPRDRLVEIMRAYGEERRAGRIAQAICAERGKGEITTTGSLSLLIRKRVPRRGALKSLSRVFQALRIAVNDELSRLEGGLNGSIQLLRRGGRVVVISYHSLEDRIAKETLRKHEALGSVRVLTKKVIKPTKGEIQENRRSRSAKMRVAEKL